MKVKVHTPETTRTFFNADFWNGKLVTIDSVGVGEPTLKASMATGDGDVWEEYPEYKQVHKPLINKTLMAENRVSRDEVLEANAEEAWKQDERIVACMFTKGENPNGYFVEVVDEEKEKEEIAQRAAERTRAKYPEKFEEAARTGKRVIIWKEVLPEEYTPLKNDGENDMVDHYMMACPDGSTAHEWVHNY